MSISADFSSSSVGPQSNLESTPSDDDIWAKTGLTRLFKGSQKKCSGYIDIDQSIRACNELNKRAPEGIRFDSAGLTLFLREGTCSAMALNFAALYLFRESHSYQNSDKSKIKHVKQLKAIFSKSSKEMRTQQAAFNTIEVMKSPNLDHSKQKIQGLAHLHQLKITQCSKELVIEKTTKEDLRKEVESLLCGVYLLRAIKPAQNSKLEEYGHSTILIKETRYSIFYDPNEGAFLILNQLPFFMAYAAGKLYDDFKTNQLRFYRLELLQT